MVVVIGAVVGSEGEAQIESISPPDQVNLPNGASGANEVAALFEVVVKGLEWFSQEPGCLDEEVCSRPLLRA